MEHSVFISHRAEDAQLAKRLRNVLKSVAARTTFFLSEDIDKSRPWLEVLQEELVNADCLFLLYTDPGADWGWCLYEAGFFTASRTMTRPGVSRSRAVNLFCLHHPKVPPPGPIQHLQTTKVIATDVEKMLRTFVEIVNPRTAAKAAKIKRATKDISNLMKVRGRTVYDPPRLKLIVPKGPVRGTRAVHLKDALPSGTLIYGRNGALSRIFKRSGDGELTWADMIRTIERRRAESGHDDLIPDLRWVRELADAVVDVTAEMEPKFLQNVVTVDDRSQFRPVLNRVKELSTGELEFSLIFVDDISSQFQNMPAELACLTIAFRMSLRTWFEIIADYTTKRMTYTAANTRARLRKPFADIITEAQSRMAGYPPIDAAFDESGRRALDVIRTKWFEEEGKLFGVLGITRETLYAELPKAPLTPREIAIIDHCIPRLREILAEFIKLSSERFKAVLSATMEDTAARKTIVLTPADVGKLKKRAASAGKQRARGVAAAGLNAGKGKVPAAVGSPLRKAKLAPGRRAVRVGPR
jgi:hypothetical protein